MTAKEKAIELVEKYVDIQKELDETTTFYFGFAQKCAIISVKDTLDILYYLSDTSQNIVEERDFYEEVLKEISIYNG